MLPFQGVEVESTILFQELGDNFTFCCVAINGEGNTSDMFHSFTITSKIQTDSLAEWGRIWGPWDYILYVYPHCLARELEQIPKALYPHRCEASSFTSPRSHVGISGWVVAWGQRLSHTTNTS